jgi:hypothetical protein
MPYLSRDSNANLRHTRSQRNIRRIRWWQLVEHQWVQLLLKPRISVLRFVFELLMAYHWFFKHHQPQEAQDGTIIRRNSKSIPTVTWKTRRSCGCTTTRLNIYTKNDPSTSETSRLLPEFGFKVPPFPCLDAIQSLTFAKEMQSHAHHVPERRWICQDVDMCIQRSIIRLCWHKSSSARKELSTIVSMVPGTIQFPTRSSMPLTSCTWIELLFDAY